MSNVTLVTVKDSVTHNPVVGANVFASGTGQGATDSSGQISVSTEVNQFVLSVTATNYGQFTTTPIDAGTPFLVFLVANAMPTTASFTVNINPDAVAVGTSLTFDNVGSPIVVTYTSGGVTVPGLTPGLQIITGSVTGYNAINQQFDVSVTTQGTIELSAPDNGLAQSTTPTATQDPNSQLLIPAASTLPSPEFVAPNTGQGTYFTMTQARMYIGNLFIDELNSIQFALQDNQIPVYGYSSRFYDALAQGKSLVQGQFTINFISEGYLFTTLKAYSTYITQQALPVNPAATTQQQRLTALTASMQDPNVGWTPLTYAAAQKEVTSLAAALGPTAVDAVNKQTKTIANKQQGNLQNLAGGDFPNAIYSDTSFDIQIQFSGAGRTVTRILSGCRLISNESILDHSGSPILDSYGFIARKLR